jgi:hypothetical protein
MRPTHPVPFGAPGPPQESDALVAKVVRLMLFKQHEKPGVPVKRQDLIDLITVGGLGAADEWERTGRCWQALSPPLTAHPHCPPRAPTPYNPDPLPPAPQADYKDSSFRKKLPSLVLQVAQARAAAALGIEMQELARRGMGGGGKKRGAAAGEGVTGQARAARGRGARYLGAHAAAALHGALCCQATARQGAPPESRLLGATPGPQTRAAP